ncbi:MAG: UvrD-helicase domain-containing protein [Eubacteriales bacterium]
MIEMQFNPDQQKAVDTIDGAVLVLAGAGSGKTRVLTGRIAKIIEEKHAYPFQILAITFTNKAAKEMKERIEKLVGDMCNDIWVLTFHAMCSRILRRNIHELNKGYTSNFVIYDDSDSVSVIKQAQKELDIDTSVMNPKTVRWYISDAKNKMLSPEEYLNHLGGNFRDEIVTKIYKKYEELMNKNNALDFDDLLIKTLELFVSKENILSYYQEKFKYIHVDEYQDTNVAQYHLVNLLAKKHGNIFVVGDDDQGIYSWRGADIKNILNFENDYPDAVVIKLEQNYRSTANILDCANSVIKNNPNRKEKKLWTQKDEGSKIKMFTAENEKSEALFIVTEIQKLQLKYTYDDIAVLYRTNSQSQVLENTLVNKGIPYKMYSGTKFYDRKEVKDVVAYLRILVNPMDDVSLARIINVPKRSLGKTTVDRLLEHALQQGISLYDVIGNEKIVNNLVPRAADKIKKFYNLIEEMKSYEYKDLSEYISYVIATTGLEKMYRELKTDDAVTRLENIGEIISAVKRYEQEAEDATLSSFLENVALTTELDSMTENMHSVTLMTIHGSKGLEFPVVFLAGMEESIFPHFRSFDDEDQMEEERRLCYVAMTRAKEYLCMSRAKTRMLFGQQKYLGASRFLSEAPEELINDVSPEPETKKINSYTFGDTKISGNLSIPVGITIGHGKPKNKETKGAKERFEKGDTVYHKTFGKGMIISATGTYPNRNLTIAFKSGGAKELSEKFAPLSRNQGD